MYLLESIQVYCCPNIPTNHLCSIWSCEGRSHEFARTTIHSFAMVVRTDGGEGDPCGQPHAALPSLFHSLHEIEENPFYLSEIYLCRKE